MSESAWDGRAFRQSLGQFATGIAVITAQDAAGMPVGMTMSSFNAVSLEPPLVLFSVDRRAHSLAALQAAEGFAINVLGQDQAALSDRFARPRTDKWDGVEHRPGHAGAPLLDGALAQFECAPYAQHDGGDHVIFVVRVLAHAVRAGGGQPLIFFGGAYRDLAA